MAAGSAPKICAETPSKELEPSTASIVVRSVPEGFDNDRREAYLRTVVDFWAETTGCSINEIVATAYDGPLSI